MAGILSGVASTVKGFFGGGTEKTVDPAKSPFYSVANLHLSTSGVDLIAAHGQVQNYYSAEYSKIERYYLSLRPDTKWSPEERAVALEKRKRLISFSKMKSSERTFLGTMTQARYDVKPAPREPQDQDISDTLSKMYAWTADGADVASKDISVTRDAWISGSGWQESYVEVIPGKKPRIIVNNQNRLAIYKDPNSRDLISYSDCQFIDRAHWMYPGQIMDAIPDKADQVNDQLISRVGFFYEPTGVADRSHEWSTFRNGRYLVVERFYKVKRKFWSATQDGQRTDLGWDKKPQEIQDYKQQNPDANVFYDPDEELWVAIVCPAMGSAFLKNERYHCQPKDPITGNVMFPLYELVDEDLGGVPTGHVEHLIGPADLFDSMIVNKLHWAKNASGPNRFIDPDFFEDNDLEDVRELAPNGAQIFTLKKGSKPQGGSPVSIEDMGKFQADGMELAQLSSQAIDDAGSTPPSLKGVSEGNVAASLNEQRVQQSYIQSQVQVTNRMNYLRRRAKLWCYYWSEYFTFQDVIRITGDDQSQQDGSPQWMEINKIFRDDFGKIGKQNDISNAMAYDMTFEDSFQSPTVRDKVRQQITQLLQMPGIGQDPVMGGLLVQYFLQMSDTPQKLKGQAEDYLKKKLDGAMNPQPEQQKDPISISLKLDNDTLHNPLALQIAEYAGVLPPGTAQEMASSPVARVQQAGAVEDAHAKHLDNIDKMHEIAGKAAQGIPQGGPVPGTNPPQGQPQPIMAGQ